MLGRRKDADERDAVGREVVAVDALQRPVPPVDGLVEDGRDAHARVQRHVPADVPRVDAAGAQEQRRVKRPARDDDDLRAHLEGHPWLAVLSRAAGRARRAQPRRSRRCRSTSASLTMSTPRSQASGRYEKSTLILAPWGQPKLQRDSPWQPCVLRRIDFIGIPSFAAPSTKSSVLRERMPSGTVSTCTASSTARKCGSIALGRHRRQPEVARPVMEHLVGDAKAHAAREHARPADASALEHADERRLAERHGGGEPRFAPASPHRLDGRRACRTRPASPSRPPRRR